MEYREVRIRMPLEMAQAVEALATRDDVTPGQIVRHAVAEELRRHAAPAKTPNRADERLVASLQTLLAEDIASSTGWAELDRRLSAKGYRMMAAGGGCALFTCDGRKLCKGSELGFTYRQLVRRFGRAMPGHPHGAAGLAGEAGDPFLE